MRTIKVIFLSLAIAFSPLTFSQAGGSSAMMGMTHARSLHGGSTSGMSASWHQKYSLLQRFTAAILARRYPSLWTTPSRRAQLLVDAVCTIVL